MKNFLLSVFISLSVPYAAFASNISEITKGNEMVVPVSIPLHPEMSSVTILRKSEFLKTLNDESVTFIPTELKNGIEFETVVLDGKIYALFDDEQYLFLEENNEWGDGFMADLTCNTVGGATGIIVAAAVPGDRKSVV